MRLFFAVALVFINSNVAHAQTWRPFDDLSCVSEQQERSDGFLAIKRERAQTVIGSYVRSAGSSNSANVTDAFMRGGVWRWGGRTGDATSVDDPIARSIESGSATLQPPDQFVVANNRASAIGNWIIRSNETGEVLGHYRVIFRARGSGWEVAQMDYFFPDYDNALIEPYCSTPGDIAAFRLEMDARGDRER